MKNLRDELTQIINSQKIDGVKFVRLNKWQWVIDKLADNFLTDGKQSLNRIWLWDSIKKPYTKFETENGLKKLNTLLVESKSYWLIASDEDGKYWVLEATGKAVVDLLSESRYFEYYITNKEVSWLICENHHGVMLLKEQHKN